MPSLRVQIAHLVRNAIRFVKPHRRNVAPSRRSALSVEEFESRLLLTTLVNGDFAVSNPGDPGFGWTIRGSGSVVSGEALLNENDQVTTGFSQAFTVPQGASALRFTITASALQPNPANAPDSFEAALLDAQTMTSLVGTATGLPNTDAFLNIQQTGEVFFGPQVTVPGASTSGQVVSLVFPVTVTLDVSSVPVGTQAILFFDLIGFDPSTSSIRLDNADVLTGPLPPALSFGLDPATDSGAIGDDLTNFVPVNLVGTTDPSLQVQLDLDGDGFDDGSTTADNTGQFTLVNVVLAEGSNAIRLQATNSSGSTIANRTITLDTQLPVSALVNPSPGGTTNQDLGFVDVQWTDVGAAGLEITTFDTGDVTITGVTVDQIERLANGRVRYRYNLDSDTLPPGPVQVVRLANAVSDLAANRNLEQTDSFTLQGVINHAPVARENTYTATEDTPLNIDQASGVLINDNDPDGDTLTAVLDSDATNGTVVLRPDGSFTYTPDQDFNGTDSFAYHAEDGSLPSNTITVTINVLPVNDAPQANASTFSTPEQTPLIISLAGFVSDVETSDANLTYVIDSGPTHGTLTGVGATPTYTPDPNFNGGDSFSYHVVDRGDPDNCAPVSPTCSAATASSIQTVAITVTPVNDVPAATDSAVSTNEGVALPVDLASLVADVETADENLTYVIDTGPTHGSLTGSGSNRTYTPNQDFNGSDSFTYHVVDRGDPDNCGAPSTTCAAEQSSPVRTISITVNPVNDAPTATDTAVSTNEDVALVIDLAALVADVETSDENLTYVIDTGPLHGSLSTTGSSRTYTPDQDFNGSDSITYHVVDRGDPDNCGAVSPTCAAALSSPVRTVTITINPVNDAPTATDTAVSTNEDVALIIDLATLVADVETADANLTYVIDTGPLHGSLSTTGSSRTYTPNQDFNGGDSFTYHVVDRGDPDNCGAVSASCAAALPSTVRTVTITLNAVNDAPTVVTPIADVTVDQGAPNTVINVSGTFTDPDIATNADVLTLSVTNSNPSLLSATLVGTTLTLAYVPSEHGAAQISVTATDLAGASVTGTFNVTVNDTEIESPCTGAGNVTVRIKNHRLIVKGDTQGNDVLIQPGSGSSDTIVVVGQGATEVNGTDSAEFDVSQRSVKIRLRRGDDCLVFDGTDVPEFELPQDLHARTGKGDDFVRLETINVSGRTRVRTGVGNDDAAIVDAVLSGTLRVRTRLGDDHVTILDSTANEQARIRTGHDDDSINIDGSEFEEPLFVIAGSDDDVVQMATDSDATDLDTIFRGPVEIHAREGHDEVEIGLPDAESSAEFQECVTIAGGQGDDSLDAGTDSDPNEHGNEFECGPHLRAIDQLLS